MVSQATTKQNKKILIKCPITFGVSLILEQTLHHADRHHDSSFTYKICGAQACHDLADSRSVFVGRRDWRDRQTQETHTTHNRVSNMTAEQELTSKPKVNRPEHFLDSISISICTEQGHKRVPSVPKACTCYLQYGLD